MKIEIRWYGEKLPTARETAGLMSQWAHIPLFPEDTGKTGGIHCLSFEADSLRNAREAISAIRSSLHYYYNIIGNVGPYVEIDGLDPLSYAVALETRNKEYESAVTVAIRSLKATRNWFRDKRFADIRIGLQKILEPRPFTPSDIF